MRRGNETDRDMDRKIEKKGHRDQKKIKKDAGNGDRLKQTTKKQKQKSAREKIV